MRVLVHGLTHQLSVALQAAAIEIASAPAAGTASDAHYFSDREKYLKDGPIPCPDMRSWRRRSRSVRKVCAIQSNRDRAKMARKARRSQRKKARK